VSIAEVSWRIKELYPTKCLPIGYDSPSAGIVRLVVTHEVLADRAIRVGKRREPEIDTPADTTLVLKRIVVAQLPITINFSTRSEATHTVGAVSRNGFSGGRE